jgi:hypothetical protein
MTLFGIDAVSVAEYSTIITMPYIKPKLTTSAPACSCQHERISIGYGDQAITNPSMVA